MPLYVHVCFMVRTKGFSLASFICIDNMEMIIIDGNDYGKINNYN